MSLKKAALGIDVGGTKIACGLVDLHGRVLGKRRAELARGSADGLLAQILTMAGELMEEGGERGFTTAACGVAVPAAIDRSSGRVLWAPNIPEWRDYPLAQNLGTALHLPVYLDHDGPAAVLGEQWVGAARGAENVIYLIIGTGVGAGLLLGGQVYRGAGGVAGGVGWFSLNPQAIEDPAYRAKGFLETIAAGPGIARRYAAALGLIPDSITAKEVFNAAARGDEYAGRILREACHYLGMAVANLVSLLNPEIVVLGGGVGGRLGPYLGEIEEVVKLTGQPQAAAGVKVVPAMLGEESGILGSARNALISSGVKVPAGI